MSGYGSIHDLIPSQSTTPRKTSAPGHSEVLAKKIHEVKAREKEMEAMRLASELGLPHIDLQRFPVSQRALKMLPQSTAEALGVVCFFANNSEFRIGAIDPTRPEVEELLHEMQEKYFSRGDMYVISERSYQKIMDLYGTLPTVAPITKDVNISAEALARVQEQLQDPKALESLLARASTSDIVTVVLAAAFKMDTSDVHIEAEQEHIVVRFRLDGILHDVAEVPLEQYKRLVSRIKLLSSLKINVTDVPQDGRFSIVLPEGDVDVRVSTIPTVYGESIVMRLLKQSREGLALGDLGVRGIAFDRLKEQIARPNGMIITTGPTGSGKTTTLYAAMHVLNKPGVKIITLEDPVEYRMEGVNQSQIDHSKGYTFGKGLRSMLRQDPDIAMVGEIRDLETAEIAVQAALTGHLMLSTIHTNSAAGAIPRFLSMGVRPFLLAPALNCVIGQRLVRKICSLCKEPVTLTTAVTKRVHDQFDQLPQSEKDALIGRTLEFYEGKGCDACNGLGYKGRMGIYEIFVMSPEIEELILSGHASEYDIERVAREQGMVTMVQDGLLKALDEITSVSEVFRVIE
jgi:type IV pilus assembly protein PilB